MPAGESLAVRRLRPERRTPAEDVRADQIFGRVEDAGLADHLVDPGTYHVRLLIQLEPVVGIGGFEVFETTSVVESPLRGDRAHRSDKAVPLERRDLLR